MSPHSEITNDSKVSLRLMIAGVVGSAALTTAIVTHGVLTMFRLDTLEGGLVVNAEAVDRNTQAMSAQHDRDIVFTIAIDRLADQFENFEDALLEDRARYVKWSDWYLWISEARAKYPELPTPQKQ